MAYYTSNQKMKPGYSFFIAAKCDFLSQYIDIDSLVYLIGSNNKYDLNNLKKEKILTNNDDVDLKICTPSHNVCDTLEDNSVTARSLNTHKRIRTGGKSHKCGTCHKLFRRAGHLKQHEQIHTGVKSYECGTCHK